ncbi:hypothetical protein CRYUN_Cryun32bG0003700 [Craigia yunnanensis]
MVAVVMASKNCVNSLILSLILILVIQSDAARPRQLGNENGLLTKEEVTVVGKIEEGKPNTNNGEMKNLPPFPFPFPLPDMPFPQTLPYPQFPPLPFPPPFDIPNVPPFPNFPLPPFSFPPIPFLSPPPP